MSMRQRMAFRSGDDEVRKLAAEVTGARERLAYLVVVPPPGVGNSKDYEEILAVARQAKEEAESKLAERSVEFVNLMAGSRVGYAAVAKARPPDIDLVAFVKYEVTHWESVQKYQVSGVSYLAFGLAAGQDEPFVVPLGSALEIDPLVTRWREHASAPEGSDPAAGESRLEIGRALRRRVWDPVRARLGGAARVFVVPDGELHLVNFSALPTDDDRYLVETGPLVHYLSVERDLALDPFAAATESLLALGGPDFEGVTGGVAQDASSNGSPDFLRGRRSSCGDFRTLRFEPLPGTKREVEAIARLWSRSGGDRSATLLTGRSAEETTFKAQAMGHRYLHVATHGFFLGQECLAGIDATRGIGGLAKREDPAERFEAPQPDASDPTERAKELERAGRWPEALELYRRAVEFRERVHGPKDPRVAESLVRLALLTRRDHDDYGLEVRPLLERAAAIDSASLSGEASILQKILDSEYQAAEDEARTLLASLESSHRADSIEAAQVMELLAEAMGKGGKGKDPEVVRLAERVLEIRKAVYGSEHVAVALSLNNLGNRMGEAGRSPVELQELFEQAIDIMKRTVGAHHWLVSASLFNIGFTAPTREEKIAAFAESANITQRYGASGAWYTADTVSHLKRLVSDPAELRELLDPGILPPEESPLLRSGLALAGAERRDQTDPDQDDGILTAEEIASLDLSGVEWAVLSACDTGVGDVKAGEGVFGLRRAFQIAGARTLIMSLWSVDDDSTREWMTALYDARLRKGKSTAESVRDASLSVLSARRKAGESTHPFHWAAFVAAGDWR
jgi:CHAT domain-containing protein